MAFIKILKSNTYCSRYQTKYRRRREGKTDYQARRRLVFQDKNKYDTKKYRFVVRRTNRRIICSVNFATIIGDKTMVTADSKELSKYKVTAGQTNYAAAYATGLLCARRLLTSIGKADSFKGKEKVDGKMYDVMDDWKDGHRPIKANLDVGLIRTTTGNRVFGAMKGASDGGISIPHSEKRFPGYKVIKQEVQTNKRGKKVEEAAEKKTEYNAGEHKDHILGAHVQSYFDMLKKQNAAAHKKQFSRWIKCLDAAKVKNMQELWTQCHAAIRKDPVRAKKAAKKVDRKVISKKPQLVIKTAKGRNEGTYLREFKVASSVKKAQLSKVMDAVAKRYAKK